MKTCDVCGKSSLLPERFGEINVCKICFLKSGGLFWKKNDYETMNALNLARQKALKNVNELGFPPEVIKGICDFFATHEKKMLPCDACNEYVSSRKSIGTSQICCFCYKKLASHGWEETDYETNQAVEENRKKTLKVASKNNYPQRIIDDINSHFNSKIETGLIRKIRGGFGQSLKIYETFCILERGKGFDPEEMQSEYQKTQSKGTVKTIAKDLAFGALTKNFVGGMTAAVLDTVGNSTEYINTKRGTFHIDYTEYVLSDFRNASENALGYIRFHNKNVNNTSSDVLLFFESNSGKQELYQELSKWMSKAKTKIATTPTQAISSADEILKFKDLLEKGIITQKEFDKKKKELLRKK